MNEMIYLYVFAILILVTIFISMLKQKQSNLTAQNLYRKIVLFSIIMLGLDIAHEYLSGVEGGFNAVLIRIISVLIFAFPAYIAVVWFKYSYLIIYRKEMKKDLYYYLFLTPMFVHIVLSLVSLIWPLYFTVSSQNVYSRGNIYLLSIVLQYLYLLVPIIMVIWNYKKIRTDRFYPLVFFTIPPMIGGTIQALHYGLLLVWPMLAFSIFVGYIFIQSNLISIDYLTGLMNKGAFENYIENIRPIKKNEKILSFALLDLDGLKNINDSHGHLIGDKVLSLFAHNLISSFDKNDFIARIGGDEFAIIKYVRARSEVENCLDKLTESIKQLNNSHTIPTAISYSYGFDILNIKEHKSIKDLIARVDEVMYESKARKRR